MTGQISPKIKDNLIIKKIRITKLNGLNYRTWVIITRAMIKAKDTWDIIKLLGPEAKTFIKSTSNKIIKRKAAESKGVTDMKVNRVINTKARIVIMGYCEPEALSKLLYLQTMKE